MKAIAIDFGGTRVKIGIVEKDKVITSKIIRKDSALVFNKLLEKVSSEINEMTQAAKLSLIDFSGIGFSMPGIVDTQNMCLLSVNEKYNDAVGFNFNQWAKINFNLPVILENDARAALVGEWKYGAGQGCDNLAVVTLGTGVGGAVVIEGKVLRGKHYQAGFLPGHFTVNYKGRKCNCGNVGCVEAEASSWQLPEQAVAHPLYKDSKLRESELIDYKEVFELAAQNDRLAEILLQESLLAWSACIINIIHAYDPEMIVIGGGIMKSADIIIPFVQQWADEHAWTPWGKVRIVQANDMDQAALLGMGYLLEQLEN